MTRLPVVALRLATVCLWGAAARAQETRPNQPPRAHLGGRRHRRPRARRPPRHRPDVDAAAVRRSPAHPGRPRRGALRRRQRAAPRTTTRSSTFSRTRSSGCSTAASGSTSPAARATSRTASMRPRRGSRSQPGEYRVAMLREARVELAVLRGAQTRQRTGRSFISGRRTHVRPRGPAPSPPMSSTPRRGMRSIAGREHGAINGSACPRSTCRDDVRRYAPAFDTYGSWRSRAAYGYVWYPRVAPGWRPYHHGRWVSLRPHGWTWIAGDPWGWPTHHYGRWGFSRPGWFWIPGRTWGPAWVSWAYAPGYVSWCPLGWNNRPVYQRQRLRRPPLRSVARVDGRSASSLQRELRQRVASRRGACRSAGSQPVRRRATRRLRPLRSRSIVADSNRRAISIIRQRSRSRTGQARTARGGRPAGSGQRRLPPPRERRPSRPQRERAPASAERERPARRARAPRMSSHPVVIPENTSSGDPGGRPGSIRRRLPRGREQRVRRRDQP